MVMDPNELEAAIAQQEALARARTTGQTQTVIGGSPDQPVAPAPTETIMPGFSPDQPGPMPTPPPAASTPPTEAPIPPSATDPIEMEIRRREAAVAPASDPNSFRNRLDQTLTSMVPPSLRPVTEAIGNIGANFNAKLADVLGWAPDTIDYALREVGSKLWDKPGSSAEKIKAAMTDAGFPAKETNDLEGMIGKGIFEGVVWAAAFAAAAPLMVARQGTTVAGSVIKSLGEFVQNNPSLNIVQNITASAGANVGEATLGGPFGAFTGATVGGFVPGIAMGTARAATYPVRLARRLFTSPEVPPAPVLTPGTDLGIARSQAQGTVTAQEAALEAQRRATIAAAGGPMANKPLAAQTQFRQTLQATLEDFRTRERAMWQPFEEVPTDFTRYQLAQTRQRYNLPPPKPTLGEIPAAPPGEPQTGPYNPLTTIPGRFTPPPPEPGAAAPRTGPVTIGELMQLRSQALEAASSAIAGPTPDRKAFREYSGLARDIMSRITSQFPESGSPMGAAIANARAFSLRLNDLFSRGTVGRVLRQSGTREAQVLPENTVTTMLQRGGSQSLSQIAEIARTPNIPGLNQAQTLPQAESAVRAIFSEAANASPKGAAQWYEKNRIALSGMAGVANDLSNASIRLTNLLAQQKELATSALSRFMGPEPMKGFANIFAAADPLAEVRGLLPAMHANPDALKAFKDGLVEHMVARTSGSGIGMRDFLSKPRINAVFRATMTPDEYRNMQRIINLGARFEMGDRTLGARLKNFGIPTIARIFGAHTGATISHMLGGGIGGLQSAAITSQVFRNWAQDAVRGIPANELLVRALRSKEWAQVLEKSVPRNMKEMRDYTRRFKRLINLLHVTPRFFAPGRDQQQQAPQ